MADPRPQHRTMGPSLMNQPTPEFRGAANAMYPNHRYGNRRPDQRRDPPGGGPDPATTACSSQRDGEAVPRHQLHEDGRRPDPRSVLRGGGAGRGKTALTTGEAPLFFLKEGYLSFPMEGASLVV